MRLHPALFCGWIACSTLSNAPAQTQILASESKDPYSKRKEESLACLPGKFRVIGQELVSAKPIPVRSRSFGKATICSSEESSMVKSFREPG